MTLLQYVEAHPWWTLLYLMLICGTVGGMLRNGIVINSGMNSGCDNRKERP